MSTNKEKAHPCDHRCKHERPTYEIGAPKRGGVVELHVHRFYLVLLASPKRWLSRVRSASGSGVNFGDGLSILSPKLDPSEFIGSFDRLQIACLQRVAHASGLGMAGNPRSSERPSLAVAERIERLIASLRRQFLGHFIVRRNPSCV
jgi:hypothetical protein